MIRILKSYKLNPSLYSNYNYFSQQGVHFNQVVFAGDGRNDLCVALSLHRDDIVLARRGYELDRILAEAGTLTQADHVAWSNGFDILKTLRRKEIL